MRKSDNELLCFLRAHTYNKAHYDIHLAKGNSYQEQAVPLLERLMDPKEGISASSNVPDTLSVSKLLYSVYERNKDEFQRYVCGKSDCAEYTGVLDTPGLVISPRYDSLNAYLSKTGHVVIDRGDYDRDWYLKTAYSIEEGILEPLPLDLEKAVMQTKHYERYPDGKNNRYWRVMGALAGECECFQFPKGLMICLVPDDALDIPGNLGVAISMPFEGEPHFDMLQMQLSNSVEHNSWIAIPNQRERAEEIYLKHVKLEQHQDLDALIKHCEALAQGKTPSLSFQEQKHKPLSEQALAEARAERAREDRQRAHDFFAPGSKLPRLESPQISRQQER